MQPLDAQAGHFEISRHGVQAECHPCSVSRLETVSYRPYHLDLNRSFAIKLIEVELDFFNLHSPETP